MRWPLRTSRGCNSELYATTPPARIFIDLGAARERLSESRSIEIATTHPFIECVEKQCSRRPIARSHGLTDPKIIKIRQDHAECRQEAGGALECTSPLSTPLGHLKVARGGLPPFSTMAPHFEISVPGVSLSACDASPDLADPHTDPQNTRSSPLPCLHTADRCSHPFSCLLALAVVAL